MRITNNMIMDNAALQINGNKTNVDRTNTQMTTQKKIDRPSEDPVIAVRSLRLQTSLEKINQYYERNIPDANSWMDVTETALLNIRDIVTDMHTLADRGANGTLTDEDRDTILAQLKQLQSQVYMEGNADYAGRTVFTGFRTDQNLTFLEADANTSYKISEPLTADNMKMNRYYNGNVQVPTNSDSVNALDGRYADNTLGPTSASMTIQETDYYRLRLSYDLTNEEVDSTNNNKPYDNIEKLSFISLTDGVTRIRASVSIDNNGEGTISGTGLSGTVKVYDNEDAWAQDHLKEVEVTPATTPPTYTHEANVKGKYVDHDEIVIIKSTGELIFGENIANTLQNNHADVNVDYTKKGFAKGELKPEYYFNCTKLTDEDGNTASSNHYDKYQMNEDGTYKKDAAGKNIPYSYSIDYTIAQNQTLGVNLEAYDIFDSNIYQDMGDMMDALTNAINAHDKVSRIKSMMQEDQYGDEKSQAKLAEWLDLANREMDYYDNNVSKLYSTMIGNTDRYLSDINHSITKLGCKMDQLKLTEKRMSDQQESVEGLKLDNDNLDLSEIILNYTSAYTAYQASLTAAGRLGQQTLLNYI